MPSGSDIACVRCLRLVTAECLRLECLAVDDHILLWRSFCRLGGNPHASLTRSANLAGRRYAVGLEGDWYVYR